MANTLVVEECGCCEAAHRENFSGDCRNDEERYYLADRTVDPSGYIVTDGEGNIWISAAALAKESR